MQMTQMILLYPQLAEVCPNCINHIMASLETDYTTCYSVLFWHTTNYPMKRSITANNLICVDNGTRTITDTCQFHKYSEDQT
jgi:hypothetical protein